MRELQWKQESKGKTLEEVHQSRSLLLKILVENNQERRRLTRSREGDCGSGFWKHYCVLGSNTAFTSLDKSASACQQHNISNGGKILNTNYDNCANTTLDVFSSTKPDSNSLIYKFEGTRSILDTVFDTCNRTRCVTISTSLSGK